MSRLVEQYLREVNKSDVFDVTKNKELDKIYKEAEEEFNRVVNDQKNIDGMNEILCNSSDKELRSEINNYGTLYNNLLNTREFLIEPPDNTINYKKAIKHAFNEYRYKHLSNLFKKEYAKRKENRIEITDEMIDKIENNFNSEYEYNFTPNEIKNKIKQQIKDETLKLKKTRNGYTINDKSVSRDTYEYAKFMLDGINNETT